MDYFEVISDHLKMPDNETQAFKIGWEACEDELSERADYVEGWYLNLSETNQNFIDENQKNYGIIITMENLSTISLAINLGDTFVYAGADSEEFTLKDIPEIINLTTIGWSAIKRNQKPVIEVIEKMKKENLWTEQMESLPDNECNRVIPRW